MDNKAKTTVLNKFFDSVKTISKKILYSITISLPAYFGIQSSANAVDLGANDIWGDANTSGQGSITSPNAGMAVDLANHALTIGNAGAALQQSIGAIVANSGSTANQILVTQTASQAALTISITSIASAVDDLVITSDNAGSAAVTVNITGTAILADDLLLVGLNTTFAGESLVLNTTGAIAVGGITVITGIAVTGGAGSNSVMNISANATYTGHATMDDAGTGRAILNKVGTAVSIVAGNISGTGAGEGTINIVGSGATTFSGTIGATNEMLAINVSSGATATFSAATDADTITSAGTLNLNEVTKTDTLTITAGTTTADLKTGVISIGGVDGSATTAITISDGATLKTTMASTETASIDAVMEGAAAGVGDFTVTSASGAAAGKVVLDGTYGANTVLGALQIGSATAGGHVTNEDGSTMAFTTVNLTAGEAANEKALLDLNESLTASGGITLTQGANAASDAVLEVSSGNALTVTGAINAAGAGSGDSTIDVNTASTVATFASTIGNSTAVDVIAIDTGHAKFAADVSATALTLANSAGNATFEGTAAQTFTGVITATNGEGTLTADNNVGLTFSSTIGATAARALEVIVDNGAVTTFNGAIAAITLDNDNVTAGRVTTFNSGGHLIGTASGNAGALQIAGGEIALTTSVVAGTTLFDVQTAAADANGVLIGAAINFVPPANFTSGDITIIDGDAATMDTAEQAFFTVQDTILTDFVMTTGTTDIVMSANQKTDAQIGTALGVSTSDAGALSQVMAAAKASDSALMAILNTAMVKTGSDTGAVAETRAILEQVAPQTDTSSGSVQATRATTGSVQNIMSDRMASLRSGDAYVTGMSAGTGMSANSAFIQAFGSKAEQKNTTNGAVKSFGYDSETAGVAMGIDGITDSGSTVGLSISHSSTDLDGKGAGKSKNSIDTYTASLYGDKVTDAGYLEASLTYGISENDASRTIITSGLNRALSAKYDSEQISLKLGGGIPNQVGDGSTFVTPFGSFTGTVISSDQYTETSTTASDALRLRVAQDDVTSAMLSVGVKAHRVTDKGTPMFSIAVNQELGDSTIDSSNTFMGGGTAFNTSTAVEEMSATLGLGYSVGSDTTSLNIGYEAEADDNEYLSHYGSIKITSKF
jgi:uncharacterized protein with beta-barrel porin domain